MLRSWFDLDDNVVVGEAGPRNRSWTTRLFESAEAPKRWGWYGRVSDNPVTDWFNALSRKHPLGSALLQSTLATAFFMVVIGAAVQFRNGVVLAIVGLLLWTVLTVWGYAYAKWQIRTNVEQPTSQAGPSPQ